MAMGAEQDGRRKGDESDVSAEDVFLECLHECEGRCGGNIHMVLLMLMMNVASGAVPKATVGCG